MEMWNELELTMEIQKDMCMIMKRNKQQWTEMGWDVRYINEIKGMLMEENEKKWKKTEYVKSCQFMSNG